MLCSESLFRCLSPTMDAIPVTIFRMTPTSYVLDASRVQLSVFLVLVIES